MTLSLSVSETAIIFFAVSGFASTSYYLYLFVSNLFYYLKYKEPKFTAKDKEVFFLKEQLKQSNAKKAALELQIQELTNGIISKLQEKL